MKLDFLIKNAVKKVFVHWSESMLINDELGNDGEDINKELTLDAFEEICQRAAPLSKLGYFKTKFEVRWQDGSITEMRIDLNSGNSSPIEHIAMYIK